MSDELTERRRPTLDEIADDLSLVATLTDDQKREMLKELDVVLLALTRRIQAEHGGGGVMAGDRQMDALQWTGFLTALLVENRQWLEAMTPPELFAITTIANMKSIEGGPAPTIRMPLKDGRREVRVMVEVVDVG